MIVVIIIFASNIYARESGTTKPYKKIVPNRTNCYYELSKTIITRKIKLKQKLWQDIKAKLFHNVFTSIKEIQDKLTKILKKYTKTTIQNITKYDYLTKIENEI